MGTHACVQGPGRACMSMRVCAGDVCMHAGGMLGHAYGGGQCILAYMQDVCGFPGVCMHVRVPSALENLSRRPDPSRPQTRSGPWLGTPGLQYQELFHFANEGGSKKLFLSAGI